MELYNGAPPPSCPADLQCYEWPRIYLQYCLCDFKDGASLFLGIISILCWSVAEIPQIVTNYMKKSTEGLSVAFLLTWIAGDLFNLIGCQLEPTTLPTQYYVALLYTLTSLILTGQSIYYGYIRHRLKKRKNENISKKIESQKDSTSVEEWKTNMEKKSGYTNQTGHSNGDCSPTSPIPVQVEQSHDEEEVKDFYFTSARSLSKSPIPPRGSWLAHSHEPAITEPLLSSGASASPPSSKSISLRSVVPSVFVFLGYYVLLLYMTKIPDIPRGGMVLSVGRKLLQEGKNESESSGIAAILGWAMAAIYMGGRLPQIWLNIRRGHAQGLNPLMFVFAIVGNTTYVASILLKSMAWSTIKPNMPWLVDAGGCVLLDIFILAQFAYFHLRKHNEIEDPLA